MKNTGCGTDGNSSPNRATRWKKVKIPNGGRDKIVVEGLDYSYREKKKNKRSSGGVHLGKTCSESDSNGNNTKARTVSKQGFLSKSQPSHVRKKVDPGTANFFHAIQRSLENRNMDSDEFSMVCSNALEETKGKELELTTDMIISSTLQTVLEGCELDHLCRFLCNCREDFPLIALDKFGSYVAETALMSLAGHLQDRDSYYIIEDILSKICQVVVGHSFDLMCSSYGSHALRRLLCLCKGVPLDSMEELEGLKPAARLAGRLKQNVVKSKVVKVKDLHRGFEDIFRSLVRGLFHMTKEEMEILRNDKYASFVLQTALKLIDGNDKELLYTISAILGCPEKVVGDGKCFEVEMKKDIMALLEDTASSHLLEAIIEVAPDAIYNELLNVIFKDSLFKMSMHHCGNFVVQALISSARTDRQLHLIWQELGSNFKELVQTGKLGVVASLLAASHRLQTHSSQCCQGLIDALTLDPGSSNCLVPCILFIDRYLTEGAFKNWLPDTKMSTLGCLMLQIIFRYPKKLIKPYITSIMSVEADHILQTAKDAGGGHVLEAFLCSNVSTEQKLLLVSKLRGHFGELSKHASGSFIVEKCFSVADLVLKEAIAEELVAVQSEVSQTKHGPYLLRKIDINGYTMRPKQWRSSHASKANTFREYQTVFGSNNNDRKRNAYVPAGSSVTSKNKRKKR